MGLMNGLATVEAVVLMLRYVLPAALLLALLALAWRWLRRPDEVFAASEPAHWEAEQPAAEEHHEPPQ